MFAIALDGNQKGDYRVSNADALAALVALACQARRAAVRVGAVRCIHELLLRNPLARRVQKRGVWRGAVRDGAL